MLVFVMARSSGDPIYTYFSEEALLYDPYNRVADFREKWGFDKPVLEQLVLYLKGVARLDFGMSISQHQPAMTLVLRHLPITLSLAVVTTILSTVGALILGSLAALYPLGKLDRLVTFISVSGATVPSFWLALMLIIIFAVQLHWLPTSGIGGIKYVILPGIVLAWPLLGLAQMVRCSVLEQLSQPYITTARAKGATERIVLFRHAARNALIPIITLASGAFIGMANGAVVVESIFGWPGIGKLLIDAINRRDFAIVQAGVFVVAILVVLINLSLDVLYAVLDPRIRYS